jgi:CRISPR type IV-associated DEAD/DEAH-box helicase Csf4
LRGAQTRDPAAWCAWGAAAARQIAHIAANATGGTLVLFTGFEAIGSVEATLRNSPDDKLSPGLGDRLVVQTANGKTAAARTEFIAKSRAGLRPVWLGCGGAATGLDLRDDEAEDPLDDSLLTDLVLTSTWLGSTSSTDRVRDKQNFMAHVPVRRAMALRQALGRLIRREGVEDRRLWLFDHNRLSYKPIDRRIAAIIADYPNVHNYDLA